MPNKYLRVFVLAFSAMFFIACEKGIDPGNQPTTEIWKGSIADTITTITHNFSFTFVDDNTYELYDTIVYGGGLVESGTYSKTASNITITPLVDRVFNTTTFTWDTLSNPKDAYTGVLKGADTATISGYVCISTTPYTIGNLTITKQ